MDLNHIVTVPARSFWSKMRKLKNLDLSFNRLRGILPVCPGLANLRVAGNSSLTSLSADRGMLECFNTLDITGTKITILPGLYHLLRNRLDIGPRIRYDPLP